MPKRSPRNRPHDPAVYALLRHLALTLPGVEEGMSYGTPAFKVGKQLFARLHQDGESLVLKIDLLKREILLQAAPETFYLTDHYLNYPYILVRLAQIKPEALRELLEQAWRLVASARLIETFEQNQRS
jgi:hypothetical protein